MDWKKISSKEWVYVNTTTSRVVIRIRKNDDVWVINRPSGVSTENAFLDLDAAKNYVVGYFNLYGKFINVDKPL